MNLVAKKLLLVAGPSLREAILTVPFLRNLRKAYPAAHIDLMLGPCSSQVIEGCPFVDRIVPFEVATTPTESSRPRRRNRLPAYRRSWNLMRECRYDAAFVLDRSLSSALLVWAAGVPRRIGFGTRGREILLTDPVPSRHDQHEVEDFLDCLGILDIPIRSRTLELWPSPDCEKKTRDLLQNAGWMASDLKIILHAAASAPAEQWPVERFAAVMKALKQRYNAHFIYTGAAGDAPLYEEIDIQGPFEGLNLCGKTTIRENISLYRSADLFFGVDSGPMHMAAAVGVPVVALFGATDERKRGPWGEKHIVITKVLECRPCKPRACTDNECMKRISVEEVLAALEKKIQPIYPKVLHD